MLKNYNLNLMLLSGKFVCMSFFNLKKNNVSLGAWLILLCFIVLYTIGELQAQEAHHSNDFGKAVKIEALDYGNILFEYYRGEPMKALNAILVAQKQQRLFKHQQEAELLAGAIYLDLGMLTHAEEIFNRLITADDLKTEILSKLEFYLGKLHYRQADFQQARFRLERGISGLTGKLKDESYIMLGNMALREKNKEKSLYWLSLVETNSEFVAFSRYNLGIIWLQENNIDKAQQVFNQIHPSSIDDKLIKALQDKAQVALGYYYLSNQQYLKAREHLKLVRLQSPLANKALLGMGWSYLGDKNYQQALSHWLELNQKDKRDIAVQEVLLAIPYAYQQSGDMQQSLTYYLAAVKTFQEQLQLVEELIEKISQSSMLDEFVANIITTNTNLFDNTGINNSHLFGPKYDYYLYELISQHRFNENFMSYQKLAQMLFLLSYWEEQLPIFDEILKVNKARFKDKLPLVEQYLDDNNSSYYQQQLEQLKLTLIDIKNNKNMHRLANSNQLKHHARINRLESRIVNIPDEMLDDNQRIKVKKARGVLQWQLESGKVAKIWALDKKIKEIEKSLNVMQQKKQALKNANTQASKRFIHEAIVVEKSTGKLTGLRDKLNRLVKVQVDILKQQILATLQEREASLKHFLLQSDLSIAHLYEQSITSQEVNP